MDRQGGGVVALITKLGSGLDERREPVAIAVVVLAVALAFRSRHEPTHMVVAGCVGLLLVARAVAMGRPFVARNVGFAAALLALADLCDETTQRPLAWLAMVSAGWVLGFPRRPPPPASADDRRHAWLLVDRTTGDTLAPFVLRTDKSFVFTDDRSAAVAYRVRFGTAIASGDPVGDASTREAAIDDFVAHAESNGWRVAVLGTSERNVDLWRARGLRTVPIGRDVVVDVASFTLEGRRFRNLRQAVQRTRNAGVTTEIVAEHSLDPALRDQLRGIMRATGKGDQLRGFSMILDHVLDGTHPGTHLAIARDRQGDVVAFQRYASADGGRELSLDVPWRKPGSPNGVDERLIVEVVQWAAQRGATSVSLAFAAFPDLFSVEERGLVQEATYRAVRTLDRFIKLESLYRFVRKFHAFGPQRYVALRPLQVIWVAVAALTLEFGSVARRRP